MLVILAQTIDALNQTLEALESIGNIESIPGALLIMGVMMFLGFVFTSVINWRITSAQLKSFELYSTAQQHAADTAQANYIVERDVAGMKIDALVTQTQSIAQIVEGYRTTLTGLTEQMTQTAQYLSKTAEALKALEMRVIAGEAQVTEHWEKVELVGKALKVNMDELKNGNGEILNELRIIRAELARVADAVEVAMTNLIATVDKLTKASAASLDEPKPDKPEGSA